MGLREDKKRAAWRAIHDAAWTLFDQQGYDATTVEQIAAAAGVSRATFFNYFSGKEGVVFDQDPDGRDAWRDLMWSRPDDEPLWDALSAVLLGFSETLRQRMPLQRELKAQTPALASRTQAFGETFRADLREWVGSREVDPLHAALNLNLAQAAMATAYENWGEAQPFSQYLDNLAYCLRTARPAQ